jgi:hypothetical protein
MASSDVFVTFGGDTGALEAAISVVKAQMNALTREMKTAAAEFNTTGRVAESDLGQKLKALGAQMAAAKGEMAGLQSGAKASGDTIKEMGQKIGDAAYNYGPWTGVHVQLAQAVGVGLATAARDGSKAMTLLGGAVGIAAAASVAAVAIVGLQVDSIRKLDESARTAKVSLSALKDLNVAGKGVGIDADQMNQEMGAFALKLREAQVAGGELADFLEKNKIAIKDMQGNLLPVQQIFGKIAEMVLQTSEETDRLKIMEKIGFSADTLGLIERHSEAVAKFAASTREAYAAQDESLKKELADGERLSTFWHSMTDAVDRGLGQAAVAVIDFDKAVWGAASTFAGLEAAGVKSLAAIAASASSAASQVNKLAAAERAAAVAMAFGPAVMPQQFGGAIPGSKFTGARSGVDPKSLYDKDEKTPKAKGGGGGGGGASDTNKDASEEAKAAIDAAKATFEQKKSLLDEYASLHLISTSDQIAGTRAAAEEEFAAQKAALEKELQLEGLKPSQRRAINDQIQKIEANHQKEMQKLQFQAVADEIKEWNKMVDTMSSSFSSGISGMIEGSKTFGQAMQSLAQSVEQHVVKMAVDMVANWVKGQIASVAVSVTSEGQKTAAAAAGAAARDGLSLSEAAAASAVTLAAVGKNIAASAAEVFGGVFGFLSPVMGPAAAVPAAAAQGAVLATVASCDIGAWNISKDQLALVHGGETIMPAAESGAFRSMLSNAAKNDDGGHRTFAPNVTINPQGRLTREEFRGHADTLVEMMRGLYRNNVSMTGRV